MSRNRVVLGMALSLTLTACSWGKRIDLLETQQADFRSEQQQTARHLTEVERQTQAHGDTLGRHANALEENRERTENLNRGLERLRAETRGVGVRNVALRPTAEMVTLFGNQSGHNARVTVSNRGPKAPDAGTLRVRTLRIPRPSDRLPVDPEVPPSELPADMQATEELDLSQLGASRQMIVPCGFQVEGHSSYNVNLNLRIQYDNAACSAE